MNMILIKSINNKNTCQKYRLLLEKCMKINFNQHKLCQIEFYQFKKCVNKFNL